MADDRTFEGIETDDIYEESDAAQVEPLANVCVSASSGTCVQQFDVVPPELPPILARVRKGNVTMERGDADVLLRCRELIPEDCIPVRPFASTLHLKIDDWDVSFSFDCIALRDILGEPLACTQTASRSHRASSSTALARHAPNASGPMAASSGCTACARARQLARLLSAKMDASPAILWVACLASHVALTLRYVGMAGM